MTSDFDQRLRHYGELTVKVALNLQPGQRLMIVGPLANGGTSLEAAPLVRHIAESAYRAGARLVETIWGDETLQLARVQYAPRDSFGEFSAWLPDALVQHVESGGAVLSIYANDPDLLNGAAPDLVGTLNQTVAHAVRPFRELVSRNGRVVSATAERGESVLRRLVETDAGASRLGEIALVPHSSPISQSGRLFYSTLFDENAASHVALGAAYKFTLTGGDAMDDEEFARAGGNRSAIHVDFMIGSADLDVDGVRSDGSADPLMRRGEWAAAV